MFQGNKPKLVRWIFFTTLCSVSLSCFKYRTQNKE